MADISVIIVSWNARNHLMNCLNSIRGSGGSMIREVIVVDNASADGSPDVVAEQFPEVTLIQSRENLGFARANNLGLKHASATYLALINSDIIVHPGCFEKLVAFLESHRGVGLVGPKTFGSDGRLQRTCRRLPTLWNTFCRSLALDNLFPRWSLFSGREMRHWDQTSQAEVDVLSGCFWLARREAVEDVDELDERFFFYAEDVDWCKRFRDAGWKVVFVPEATATHFGGGSSNNAPLRYSIEMLRANLIYWRKHRGIPGEAVFYVLSVIHHSLRLTLRGLNAVSTGDWGGETAFKFKRSLVCLRWLLTGKEVGKPRGTN
ncbi:MAG: glycosyltransferase family 2 protein [Verrucomicrobiota bacterium]